MSTTYRSIEENAIVERRGSVNRPITMLPAAWDHHRSVRILIGETDHGLATTAYSYALTDAEKVEAAARIAALWSLAAAQGWSTTEIKQMAVQAANSG